MVVKGKDGLFYLVKEDVFSHIHIMKADINSKEEGSLMILTDGERALVVGEKNAKTNDEVTFCTIESGVLSFISSEHTKELINEVRPSILSFLEDGERKPEWVDYPSFSIHNF